MTKIAPSILTADFLNLGSEIKKLESIGSDMIHIDVMDGVFVPNISIGMPIISAIKKVTSIPLDVHLMIINPFDYIKPAISAGADIITFHIESKSNAKVTLELIKSFGKSSSISVKPSSNINDIFPLLHLCDMVLIMSVEPGFGGQSFLNSSLQKIEALKKERERQNLTFEIQVDGGINEKTAPLVVSNGADILVVGSYLLGKCEIKSNYTKLMNAIKIN